MSSLPHRPTVPQSYCRFCGWPEFPLDDGERICLSCTTWRPTEVCEPEPGDIGPCGSWFDADLPDAPGTDGDQFAYEP